MSKVKFWNSNWACQLPLSWWSKQLPAAFIFPLVTLDRLFPLSLHKVDTKVSVTLSISRGLFSHLCTYRNNESTGSVYIVNPTLERKISVGYTFQKTVTLGQPSLCGTGWMGVHMCVRVHTHTSIFNTNQLVIKNVEEEKENGRLGEGMKG